MMWMIGLGICDEIVWYWPDVGCVTGLYNDFGVVLYDLTISRMYSYLQRAREEMIQ